MQTRSVSWEKTKTFLCGDFIVFGFLLAVVTRLFVFFLWFLNQVRVNHIVAFHFNFFRSTWKPQNSKTSPRKWSTTSQIIWKTSATGKSQKQLLWRWLTLLNLNCLIKKKSWTGYAVYELWDYQHCHYQLLILLWLFIQIFN